MVAVVSCEYLTSYPNLHPSTRVCLLISRLDMEERKRVKSSASGTRKTKNRLNQPTSAKENNKRSVASKETCGAAVKAWESSSLSAANSAVLSLAESSMEGGGRPRPRLVSESQDMCDVECPTIELPQKLTSITVCSRNASSARSAASTTGTSVTTEGEQQGCPLTATDQPTCTAKPENQSIQVHSESTSCDMMHGPEKSTASGNAALSWGEFEPGCDSYMVKRIKGQVNAKTVSNSCSDQCLQVTEHSGHTPTKDDKNKTFKVTSSRLATSAEELPIVDRAVAERRSEAQFSPVTTPQEFNQRRPQEFKQRSESAHWECLKTNKELCSTVVGSGTSTATVSAASAKKRLEIFETEYPGSNKDLCSTEVSQYGSKEILSVGKLSCLKRTRRPHSTVCRATVSSQSISKEKLDLECAGSNRKWHSSASLSLSETVDEALSKCSEGSKQTCSTAVVSTSASSHSLPDSKVILSKAEEPLSSSTVTHPCTGLLRQMTVRDNSDSESSLIGYSTDREATMPRRQTLMTKEVGAASSNGRASDSQPIGEHQLEM